ncbi:YggT family protein [Neobacillus ginsengisoli]|uniref:YggT family protein n=1 Tax=Neobacillus ginsengisoli TaxID=904295 RepID=A0ABT9XSH4_9BACI|nr:YggT family protein [Neobacillus ginsengisoli]MDQ0198516.1 YggT family protein [Neobacillus ginsengisoli]
MHVVFNLLIDLIGIYKVILIIYILMSWFPNMNNSQIGSFLSRICEPFLEPFRRIIPPIGMMDLSPLAAFLVLNFVPNGLRAVEGFFG